VPVGPGPYGVRMFVEVTGGTIEGERVRGKVLTGGGDRLLAGPDGFGRLDVRGQMETADGASLYTTYPGVLEMNEAVQQAMAGGGETSFDDQYFRTTPRFETGDERYAWMNQNLFVARGRLIASGV